MFADKIFYNGTIYTMTSETSQCQAFAVRDGKIAAVGTNEQILNIDASEKINLNGKIVFPGFIDAHMHLLHFAESLSNVDLRGCTSITEVQARLRCKVKETPPGTWIRGTGFDHEIFDIPILPTKKDLDSISTLHPILISRYCMHIFIANSLALKIANTGHNGEPADTLQKNSSGEYSGILRESGASPVLNKIPRPYPTYDSVKDAMAKACKLLSAAGLTGAHPIQGKSCDAEEYIKIYQDLDKENRLPLRVYVSFDEYPTLGIKTGFGNDKVKYGFYKIYSDGSLGSRDAALFEPYSDDPKNTGVLNHTQQEMINLCQKAYDMDLQIGIHAIGDKGLDYALTSLETIYKANPKPDQRFRIIHAMCCNMDLLERLKKLNPILDIQPAFMSNKNIDWSIDRLGPERITWSYPWKTYIKNGLTLTGSSDLPVESYSPLWGIFSIVNRQAADGHPKGGWRPEERVSVYEALCMYTKNAAYASFEENIKGTLENGKFADFVILSDNPYTVEPFAIKDIQVEATYLSGNTMYQKE